MVSSARKTGSERLTVVQIVFVMVTVIRDRRPAGSGGEAATHSLHLNKPMNNFKTITGLRICSSLFRFVSIPL